MRSTPSRSRKGGWPKSGEARHPERPRAKLRVEELEPRVVPSEVSGMISLQGTGAPHAGARMTLFTPNVSFFREVRSNAQGAYQFADVPNGTYRLGVAGRGFEYEEIQVTVNDSTAVGSFQLEPETNPGRWSFIGDIAPEILSGTGTATLLPNGQEVFICHDTEDPVIFNFITGQKRFPPSSGREAHGHATTLLTDGRIFFAGGGDGIGGGPQGANPTLLRQAKIYDPTTNTWTNLPNMNVGRWYPSIVRLPDERLLVFAGDTGTGRTNTAEIYDVRTNSWTLVGSFRRPQDMPPAVLLYTGEVLKTWRDPELFNLQTNSWRDAGAMLQGRAGAAVGQHSDHMTVLLADGRAVVLGIDPTSANPSFTEIYNPATNTWSLGSSPLVMRQRPEAMILPGGMVLAYGGEYTGTLPAPVPLGTAGSVPNVTKVTDLYDPATNSWRRLADMNRFIHYHNVSALLPDGRVLDTAGAGSGGPFGQDQRVEAFEPPYLFRGVRPRIDSLSTTDLAAGAIFSLGVSRTSAVTEVVMIGTRATTHWIDGGTNRYLSLNFTQTGSTIQATVPSDQVRALSGWYLLMVMVDDIPSEARIVRIDPSPLRVVSTTSTPTGFTTQFNRAIDSGMLNLFDTQAGALGPSDVTLTGSSNGPVRGSLVVNPAGTAITFIRTGGVLPADTYTLTLRSAANAFKDTAGRLLDGNGDGMEGDQYVTTLVFNPPSAVTVGVPDFTRGPGQAVLVPAVGAGLQLRLSNGVGVTSVQLTLRYDPILLTLTGASVGAGVPAGATVALNTTTPGAAVLNFNSPTHLNAGAIDFVRLNAAVPISAPYGSKHILDLTGIQINGGSIGARDDDGIHVVGYFGDTTGNAGYSAADAQRALRVAVGLDSGFADYQLADPVIIADVTGNGTLNSTDATRILQEAVGLDRAEIPPLPPGVKPIPASGPDPLLNIPRALRGRRGGTVTVPVRLDLSDGLVSADLALAYDARRLEVVEVRRGSLTGDFDLFAVNVDRQAGTIRAGLARSAGLVSSRGAGSVLEIIFRVRQDAPPGRTVINLRRSLDTSWTQMNEGRLDLNPDPSDAAGDVVDGEIKVGGLARLRRGRPR